MKKSKGSFLFLIVISTFFSFTISAQTILQTVDFETDGASYTASPLESNANTSDPDYWIRTNGTTPAIYSSNTFSTPNGNYFFAAEDLDNVAAGAYTVTCDAVSVSGYENLQIKLLVGGTSTGGIEGEEYIKIQYNIDGGGWVTRAQFIGPQNTATNTRYGEDEDANGTIDGAAISETLTEFTYSIPVTGSSLQVRIEAYCGGSEEVAFDYIRVLGTEVVPVELISFNVSLLDNLVKLYWQTATEVNNYGFSIERKSEVVNREWEVIGFVEGHGNSNSPKEYFFMDTERLSGVVKYRLKQIDTDGGFEYSPVVELNLNSSTEFAVKQNFPNPFNPSTLIEFNMPNSSNVEVKVYNALGMEVGTLLNEFKQAGTHKVEFNASRLSSGIYFYRVVSGNNSMVRKMVLLR